MRPRYRIAPERSTTTAWGVIVAVRVTRDGSRPVDRGGNILISVLAEMRAHLAVEPGSWRLDVLVHQRARRRPRGRTLGTRAESPARSHSRPDSPGRRKRSHSPGPQARRVSASHRQCCRCARRNRVQPRRARAPQPGSHPTSTRRNRISETPATVDSLGVRIVDNRGIACQGPAANGPHGVVYRMFRGRPAVPSSGRSNQLARRLHCAREVDGRIQ